MLAATRTTGWPKAATLIGIVVAGIVVGASGALAMTEISERAEPELVLGGLRRPLLEDGADPPLITVGLAVNNHGRADFVVTDIRVPGWTLADPELAATPVPAGEWADFSVDLVADCGASDLGSGVELVGADGETVVLEGDVQGLTSMQQRACVARDDRTVPASPTVEEVGSRTAPDGGVLHVDIDVAHPGEAGLDFALVAVTGHASGFTVDLPERLTDLDAGVTTTVTTDWRVRDCGGAAGTTGSGAPDVSSSGNFEGVTLHLYWSDGSQEEPVRTDIRVDLPPDVIVALARFAVTECGAGSSPRT